MSSIVKHTEVTDYSKELRTLLFLKTQQNTTNLLDNTTLLPCD